MIDIFKQVFGSSCETLQHFLGNMLPPSFVHLALIMSFQGFLFSRILVLHKVFIVYRTLITQLGY